MPTPKKTRGNTILKQMLSDKKEFKDVVQNSSNNFEIIVKLDKLKQKRTNRTVLK